MGAFNNYVDSSLSFFYPYLEYTKTYFSKVKSESLKKHEKQLLTTNFQYNRQLFTTVFPRIVSTLE